MKAWSTRYLFPYARTRYIVSLEIREKMGKLLIVTSKLLLFPIKNRCLFQCARRAYFESP